jgi:hypothetical protein
MATEWSAKQQTPAEAEVAPELATLTRELKLQVVSAN